MTLCLCVDGVVDGEEGKAIDCSSLCLGGFFSLLFCFFCVFLHDRDHKMSVANSCVTMQTGLAVCCPSPAFFVACVSVGEWGMGKWGQLELDTMSRIKNKKKKAEEEQRVKGDDDAERKE